MDGTAPYAPSKRGARQGRVGLWLAALCLALLGSGCTPLAEFVRNGFKVGPNYQRPPAPLAPAWIDAANPQVKSVPADYSAWWSVFADPVLDDLVRIAYAQNVNLRVAGTRVLEARAQRAIAVGTLFPQTQTKTGAFTHVQESGNTANVDPHRFFDNWATNFNASWEIDFWGRIRGTIESTGALVESSVDDYDNVMVTLIGGRVTWLDAFVIETLSQPIRATSLLVPAGIGTQELGGVWLCTFLGMSEADAVTLWLLKRARETFFDGFGFAYLAQRGGRLALQPTA